MFDVEREKLVDALAVSRDSPTRPERWMDRNSGPVLDCTGSRRPRLSRLVTSISLRVHVIVAMTGQEFRCAA